MPKRSHVLGFVAATGMLIGAPPVSAGAAPQSACALVSVSAVRAIVGAPVDVFAPGSHDPASNGKITTSTCTFASPAAHGRAATFSLMWGSAATLASTNDFYVKRHQEQPRIKGDVLILASVRDGAAIDLPASRKLLDAVAKNVGQKRPL
jgi:hypothetical protein